MLQQPDVGRYVVLEIGQDTESELGILIRGDTYGEGAPRPEAEAMVNVVLQEDGTVHLEVEVQQEHGGPPEIEVPPTDILLWSQQRSTRRAGKAREERVARVVARIAERRQAAMDEPAAKSAENGADGLCTR
jgi:hypothetical protein